MTKIATNLEQSKVLKDILPLESSDMEYRRTFGMDVNNEEMTLRLCAKLGQKLYIPAWSLAALLGVFSKVDDNIEIWSDHEDWHLTVAIYDVESRSLVDACYEMILKLHKEGLL